MSNDIWTQYNTTSSSILDNNITGINEDFENKIWIGTSKGVSRHEDTYWESFTVLQGLVSNVIITMSADNNGVIWVGTDQGAASYDEF